MSKLNNNNNKLYNQTVLHKLPETLSILVHWTLSEALYVDIITSIFLDGQKLKLKEAKEIFSSQSES